MATIGHEITGQKECLTDYNMLVAIFTVVRACLSFVLCIFADEFPFFGVVVGIRDGGERLNKMASLSLSRSYKTA